MKVIIIETIQEFQEFLERSSGFDWIAVPVYCNGDAPVHTDSLSVLYIYTLNLDEEVILVFNHTEGLSLEIELLNSFPKDNKIFVWNKKKFMKFLDSNNLIDMSMVQYFQTNQSIDDDFDTPAHEFFTSHFGNFSNLNTIIPITKHLEKCQLIAQRFLDVYDYYHHDEAFEFYNSIVLDSLRKIEMNGLYTNTELYKEKFEKAKLFGNYAYSEYNIYTTTGRPSNRYGGINFAALKKEDGSRAPFVSRFGAQGFLMSFDYDAYHLRLLAELVDYKFPPGVSVHHYLGSFYFDKPVLSDAEYQESKAISFRQLYGGISPDYLVIPFFDSIYKYTQLLWEKFRNDGYIETPVFGRKLYSRFFTDMNAAKLLNYLLQSYETERNMAVIHNLLYRISSYSSKLTLYTYDSFLIDFDMKDGGQIVRIVKEELEQNGKFPVKIEIGADYNNMQDVTRKI
jgi:hypothetical protein